MGLINPRKPFEGKRQVRKSGSGMLNNSTNPDKNHTAAGLWIRLQKVLL
jgi:hypothetical protein